MKNSIKTTAIAAVTLLAASLVSINTASAGDSGKKFLQAVGAVAIIGAIANSNQHNNDHGVSHSESYSHGYAHGSSDNHYTTYEVETYNDH